MGHWYDYLPIIGPMLAAGEQKQGDLTAAAQSQQLGQNLYTQALTGLGQAENYYGPAQAELQNAYGAPGALTGGPGQYPLAPAKAK